MIAFFDAAQFEHVPLASSLAGQPIGDRHGDRRPILRPRDEREVVGTYFAAAEKTDHPASRGRDLPMPGSQSD